jgi:hypothetical protein
VGLANLGSELETCVGSRVRLVGVLISFEKNFYRLPFTPPIWFAISVLQRVSNVFGLKGGNKSSMSEMRIVRTLGRVVRSFMLPMILEAR